MKIEDFKELVKSEGEFSINDGTDTWNFHKHRKLTYSKSKYIHIATSNDKTLLLVNNLNNIPGQNLFTIDEDCFSYFCFSFTELFYRNKLLKLFSKLQKSKTIDYTQLLNEYSFDPGCLYWIASGTMTSIFDEKLYNEKRNAVAAEHLKQVAEHYDPRACSELASYYAIENTDSDLEFYYLKKSIIKGDFLAKKKFVEFIIDERNDEINTALTVLSELKKLDETKSWACWKEANIFLKGLNNNKDIARGIELLKIAVNDNYPLAMADYSFFLYKGIGIKEDKELSLKILNEANKLTNGNYTELIEKLK